MPIPVRVHDSTSSIKVSTHSSSTIEADAGSYIDTSALEALINEEIQNRIKGDQNLQEQIDQKSITLIDITENEDGSILISLLNENEEIISSDTITITDKIIKAATLDYNNSKIVYTCSDDSTIELNISTIVDNISDCLSRINALESGLSALSEVVSDQGLALSEIVDVTIPSIESSITEINLALSEQGDDIEGINDHLEIVDRDLATAIAELSILDQKKIDKILTNYPNINPSELTQEQIKNLLVYVSNNGIPNYAKLNELGFSRITDIEDIDKAASGDLLIDME